MDWALIVTLLVPNVALKPMIVPPAGRMAPFVLE